MPARLPTFGRATLKAATWRNQTQTLWRFGGMERKQGPRCKYQLTGGMEKVGRGESGEMKRADDACHVEA